MRNLETLLNGILTTENDLQETYKNIFIGEATNHDTIEEVKEGIERGSFTCVTGCIGALIYYSQTEAIFKDNFNEVLELIEEMKEEYGELNIEFNANDFVWASFEYMVNKWLYEIENYLEDQEGEEE